MRSRTYLEGIERFVEFSHGTRWNTLVTDLNKPLAPENGLSLGYCFKYQGPNQTIYRVVCRKTDVEDIDYRIKMHEYGHIYLGHLDEVYAELDGLIYEAIKNNRDELADYVNKECGIDFGEKLLERILDDPQMNHEIHNIAMDMEVNSKILSDEDIEDLEKKITEFILKPQLDDLEKQKATLEKEEEKAALDDYIKKLRDQAMLKLILPCRYHDKAGNPFPNELTYPEYLIKIVQNLDQFIKMLVSISMGGNGDTSSVSKEDIQDALRDAANQSGSGGSSQQGNDGSQSLSDLMDQMGMSQGSDSPKDCPYKGVRDHQSPDQESTDKDREEATKDGSSHYSGKGCGLSGGPDTIHQVKNLDPIEMSLEEVIQNFKTKVVHWRETRDLMWNWNRGINRTLISPSYKSKFDVETNPTIVFLIDISGSMDESLIDRCLGTISKKMKKINGGLKYNVITWSTRLGEHIKDINPRKPIPCIHKGGGTRLAQGIKYFKENYDKSAILIIISDLEDYLEEWAGVEKDMKDYTMYAFNYGYNTYRNEFRYIKVKNFTNSNRRY